uniref:Sodium-coupled monocarboxylate transporter 2 n=1 Tax=Lygus hesperus TaxID=30085 RepID=A0A0K8T9N2_LYGHE
MSASLNTLSGTFYRDLLYPVFKVKPSEPKALLIIKTLVVVFGTVSVLGVYVIKRFGNLVMIVAYCTGLTIGPVVGIFILGLLFPWATNKGAICGGLAGFLFVGWLTVANAIYKSYDHFVYPTKELRVDGCLHNFTAVPIPQVSDDSGIPYIYRITVSSTLEWE